MEIPEYVIRNLKYYKNAAIGFSLANKILSNPNILVEIGEKINDEIIIKLIENTESYDYPKKTKTEKHYILYTKDGVNMTGYQECQKQEKDCFARCRGLCTILNCTTFTDNAGKPKPCPFYQSKDKFKKK